MIGEAVLELTVDTKPLDVGLANAERKVAEAAAIMQKLLDRHVDVSGNKLGALAAALDTRMAQGLASLGSAVASMSRDTTAAYAKMRVAQGLVAESLERTAAIAVAASDVEVAAADRVTKAYLEQAAAAGLARDAGDASIARALAVGAAPGREGGGKGGFFGVEGVRGPGHAGSRINPLVVVLEAGRYTSLGGLAAAVGENSLTGGPALSPTGGPGSGTAASTSQRPTPTVVQAAEAKRENDQGNAALLLATQKLAEAIGKKPTTSTGSTTYVSSETSTTNQQGARNIIVPAKTSGNEKPVPVVITDQTGKAQTATQAAAADALAADTIARTARSRGEGAGSPVVAGVAAGGRGGGRGGGVNLPLLLWGHGGGGGGGGRGYYGGGLAGRALIGAAGLGAGVGSLGSFAGFGTEHIVLTLGAIAGSGLSAAAGGGLLAGGALGKLGVGAGSDLAVLKSTVEDTKSLSTALEAVGKADRIYGKGSEQAAEATAELNNLINELGNTAGVKAEIGLAKATDALNHYWDQATSRARVEAVKSLMPFIGVAHEYIPLIANAATQNFRTINENLKPLLNTLKGPEFKGFFEQLENGFRQEIPEAMHALNQGLQFVAKSIAYVAPLTGAFLNEVNAFFTKWNEPGNFARWETTMARLISDFHVWASFVKQLGGALVDLFTHDAHTGTTIIEDLTVMLERVREWEKSTEGGNQLHNLFTVHREEVLALLKLVPILVGSFGKIYLALAPPLVKIVTAIANLVTKLAELGPGADWLIGLTLLGAKLKVLGPIFNYIKADAAALGKTLFGIGAGETSVAAGEGEMAAGGVAGGAAATGEKAAAAGGTVGLLGGLKSTAIKGALGAGAGYVAGSVLTNAVGLHGTAGTAVTLGLTGAGLGLAVGGPIGAAVGGAVGAGLGIALTAFKHKAPTEGKEWAERFLKPYEGQLGKIQREGTAKVLSKAQQELQSAEHGARVVGLNPRTGLPEAHTLLNNKEVEQKAGVLGSRAGKIFVERFNSVPDQGKFVFLSGVERTLNELPKSARGSAAQAMLEYATELEHRGVLPQHAVQGIIKDLERQFPELTQYLKEHGAQQDQALAQAFELKQAQKSLKDALSKVSQEWDTNGEDTKRGVNETLSALARQIKGSSGALKRSAEEAFGQVKTAAVKEADAARVQAGGEIKRLSTEMPKLGQPGIEKSEKAWENWRGSVEKQMELGVVGVQQGTELINKSLTTELKELGVPTSIGKALTTAVGKNPAGSGQTPGTGSILKKGSFGHARGAWVGHPGEAGADNIPITVGAGEAILNRHQQPEVESALAVSRAMGYGRYGSLGELFSGVTTPHYMAGGGLVKPKVGGSGAIPAIVRGVFKKVSEAAKNDLGKATAQIHSTAGKGSKAEPGGAGGTAAGSAQMRAWAKEGLEAAGVPATATNIGLIVGRMQQESGGNPDAINLWDSNAQAGHPSQGLMQTIPETFARYHVAGTSSNIDNPVANVAAAVRYMLGTYGHLVGAGSGGYATGGIVAPGGKANTGGTRVPGGNTHLPKKAKRLPKGKKTKGWQVPGVNFKMPAVNNYLESLTAVLGSDGRVAALQEQFSLLQQGDELHLPGNGEYITTQHIVGGKEETLAEPEVNQAAVEGRLGQIHELMGVETSVKTELEGALGLITPILAELSEAIGERKKIVKEIEAIVKQLKAALEKKLKEIKKKIRANLKELKKLEKELERVKQGKAVLALQKELEAVEDKKASVSLEKQLEEVEGRKLPSGEAKEPHTVLPQITGTGKARVQSEKAYDNAKQQQEREEKAYHESKEHSEKGAAAAKSRQESEENSLKKQIRASNEKQEGKKNALAKSIKAAEEKQKSQEAGLEAHIKNVGARNVTLGGDTNEIGTGGEIGTLTAAFEKEAGSEGRLTKQMALKKEQAVELEAKTKEVGETRAGVVGASGNGGSLGEARFKLEELAKQAGELEPAGLAKALAEARGTTSAAEAEPSYGETQAHNELTQALEQQNETLAAQFAVSQAQYKVLSNLPPFGGSFATGGMVPGPLGSPRLALVHGGETVNPAGGSPNVYVGLHGKAQSLAELIDVRIEKHGQKQARLVSRPLPSAGGASW